MLVDLITSGSPVLGLLLYLEYNRRRGGFTNGSTKHMEATANLLERLVALADTIHRNIGRTLDEVRTNGILVSDMHDWHAPNAEGDQPWKSLTPLRSEFSVVQKSLDASNAKLDVLLAQLQSKSP